MPLKSSNRIVYVEVEGEVFEAARERCESRLQNLSAICRAILYRAAQEAVNLPAEVDEKKLRGERLVDLHRLRFIADKEQYAIAKRRLRSRGLSVGHVINEGLTTFALTGKIS